MPSSTLESWSLPTGLETTAPRVGACFLGLLGRALPKCVKAVLDGNSGTVSTISDELLEAPLALGVLVKRSGESSTTVMLGRIFRPCNFLLDVCGVEMGEGSDFCDVASDPDIIDSCSSDSDTETDRFLSTSGVKLRFFFVLPT